jgi:hypothetical protein
MPTRELNLIARIETKIQYYFDIKIEINEFWEKIEYQRLILI